jgi:hypothetical protein
MRALSRYGQDVKDWNLANVKNHGNLKDWNLDHKIVQTFILMFGWGIDWGRVTGAGF